MCSSYVPLFYTHDKQAGYAERSPISARQVSFPMEISDVIDTASTHPFRAIVIHKAAIFRDMITQLARKMSIECVSADTACHALDVISQSPGFDLVIAEYPVGSSFPLSSALPGFLTFAPSFLPLFPFSSGAEDDVDPSFLSQLLRAMG